MRMVRSKVAGVSFRNPNGSDRQRIIRKFCRAGGSLDVRLEPDNRYSEDAIGLWVRGRWLFIFPARYQIGYVKEAIASEIREDVVRGCRISVRILEVTGGGWFRRRYYGVNIEIRLGSENDVASEQRTTRPSAQQPARESGSIELAAPSRPRLWPTLKDTSTGFLSSAASTLWRGVTNLLAWIAGLPGSQRIIAVGLAVCAAGAANLVLGIFLAPDAEFFRHLAPHRGGSHHRWAGHFKPRNSLLLLRVGRKPQALNSRIGGSIYPIQPVFESKIRIRLHKGSRLTLPSARQIPILLTPKTHLRPTLH
jgi:hypothetical protein